MRIGFVATTPHPCSCFMCGHRRGFEGRTIQGRRAGRPSSPLAGQKGRLREVEGAQGEAQGDEEAMTITTRRLESGYWHVRGQGPCNWSQPPHWPCDEATLRKHAFPEASEEFISAALRGPVLVKEGQEP